MAVARTAEKIADVSRTQRRRWLVVKRAVDIAASLVLMALLSPLWLLIALAVRIDSSGPVLFRQVRLGRGGAGFVMLKFRSMTTDASSDVHSAYIELLASADAPVETGLRKLTRDARVTRVGRVLRGTSLDETPQLLNVLVGHMSLVGPRPALDYELAHYSPRHFLRFDVRPGLTGLWQVSGRARLGFVEMLDLDVEYVERFGPAQDARILVKTPRAVLTRETA